MNLSKYIHAKFFTIFLIIGVFVIGVLAYLIFHPSNGNSVSPELPKDLTGWGEIITFSGEMVCLPHKNSNGPQTMECAYGLKTPEGMYYALRDTDKSYKHISGISMGKNITVRGKYTPQRDTIYPTEGIIAIENIEEN